MKHQIQAITGNTFLKRLRGKIFSHSEELFFLSECQNIHTFFMLMPLHLIWIDKEYKIIKKDNNILPWKIKNCKNAYGVLEIPVSKKNESLFKALNIGDIIEFYPH